MRLVRGATPVGPLAPRPRVPPCPTVSRLNGASERADARTRTGDPFITSEVLYQLSYVGLGSQLSARNESPTLTIPPPSTLA